jgi:hypothetical protein
MTFIEIATIINGVFLIASHLNTWLPITFSWFRKVQNNYSALVAGMVGVVFVARHMRHRGYPPDLDQIHKAIYGYGPPLSVVLEYRYNWLSFFLYEIVIWLLILLFGS